MIVTGTHGIKSIDSNQLTIQFNGFDNRYVVKNCPVLPHPGLDMGSQKIGYKELKRSCKHMWPLPSQFLSILNEGVIIGQVVFSLIRPLEYKSCGLRDPWVLRTLLGWTTSGPLPRKVTCGFKVSTQLAIAADPLSEQVKIGDISSHMHLTAQQVADPKPIKRPGKSCKKALSLMEKFTRLGF